MIPPPQPENVPEVTAEHQCQVCRISINDAGCTLTHGLPAEQQYPTQTDDVHLLYCYLVWLFLNYMFNEEGIDDDDDDIIDVEFQILN